MTLIKPTHRPPHGALTWLGWARQDPGSQIVDFKTMSNGRPIPRMSPYTKVDRSPPRDTPAKAPVGGPTLQ